MRFFGPGACFIRRFKIESNLSASTFRVFSGLPLGLQLQTLRQSQLVATSEPLGVCDFARSGPRRFSESAQQKSRNTLLRLFPHFSTKYQNQLLHYWCEISLPLVKKLVRISPH